MSGLLERARRGERLDDLGIVDMHGHLGRCAFAVPQLSAEGLVRVMDRIGVRTIVVSHTRVMCGRVAAGNDEVCEATRQFPGRVLGYVILWPSSNTFVREETERRLEAGFVGIKLHSANGFPYTMPEYVPAFEIANRRRLPVLLHTYGGEAELSQVRELAPRYPGANLLLAHAGVRNVPAYVALVREFANVHLDLCLSRTPRDLVERLCAEAGPDRIVWGSDATFLNMAHQIGKVLGARIADEDKIRLLSTNACRLLTMRTA